MKIVPLPLVPSAGGNRLPSRWLGAAVVPLLVACVQVPVALGGRMPPRSSPAPFESDRPASPPLVARSRVQSPAVAASGAAVGAPRQGVPAAPVPLAAARQPLPPPLRASPPTPPTELAGVRQPQAGAAALPAASQVVAETPPAQPVVTLPVLPSAPASVVTLPVPQPAPAPFASLPAPTAARLAVAAPYSAAVAARFPDPLVSYRTPAFEPGRSEFTTHAEMQTQLRGLVRSGANGDGLVVRLLAVGVSQEGQPIDALLYTRAADPSVEGVLAERKPTVLLIGQQHGDEPAGAEALLIVAEQLARGPLQPVLDRINVIVLPRANPDGARRNSHASASGVDIDRDHLLLKTPEARALAQLVRDYRPLVVIDAHEYTVVGRYLEKFGTVQRFDALLQYAMTGNVPEFVTRAADEWFREPLLAAFARESLSPEWYYTTSADIADKKLSMGGTQPDTGRNVNGLKNAISLLIETRGAGIGRTHLLRRVHTHVVAAASVLASAAQRAGDLAKLRQYVDAEVSALACRGQAVIESAPTPSEYALTMLDPASGGDRTVNVAWESALALVPLKTRARPCGYWLAADQTDAVQRLRELGVKVHQFVEPGRLRGEAYRETARERGARRDVRGEIEDAKSIERVSVALASQVVEATPGSYYVALGQPLAHLAMAALEPDTQNSYFANGLVDRLPAIARVTTQPDAKLFAAP